MDLTVFKLGVAVKLTADQAAEIEAEITQLRERVKELEIEKQLLISEIEPLLDMQDGGEYYTRNSLADDIYEKFIGGSSAEALNKFALEQKIGVLESLKELGRIEEVYGGSLVIIHSDDLNEHIEQLRKGVE